VVAIESRYGCLIIFHLEQLISLSIHFGAVGNLIRTVVVVVLVIDVDVVVVLVISGNVGATSS